MLEKIEDKEEDNPKKKIKKYLGLSDLINWGRRLSSYFSFRKRSYSDSKEQPDYTPDMLETKNRQETPRKKIRQYRGVVDFFSKNKIHSNSKEVHIEEEKCSEDPSSMVDDPISSRTRLDNNKQSPPKIIIKSNEVSPIHSQHLDIPENPYSKPNSKPNSLMGTLMVPLGQIRLNRFDEAGGMSHDRSPASRKSAKSPKVFEQQDLSPARILANNIIRSKFAIEDSDPPTDPSEADVEDDEDSVSGDENDGEASDTCPVETIHPDMHEEDDVEKFANYLQVILNVLS
jgi:hypothetical protein